MRGRSPNWLNCNQRVRLVLASLLTLASGVGQSPAPRQTLFSTPEQVVQALEEAADAKDQAALTAIFGPEREKLLSGDPVEDSNALNRFAARLREFTKIEKVSDGKARLLLGQDQYPFAVPIVKQDGQWRFDTAAGLDEILSRRIGENELSAIATCRAYVIAQWEYFTQPLKTSRDGLAVYAQKFRSTPGMRDGLYWETPPGAAPSPMGALFAQARDEGYARSSFRKDGAPRQPFHGYYFKILTRQGPHSPGGSFSYVINGNMIAGHALVAYPDKWGSAGVMTFIVNNQGRVYEKNLGPRTLNIARAMTEYDPDPSWKLAGD
jgi:hypothetical protein